MYIYIFKVIIIIIYYLFLPSLFLIFDRSPAVMGIPLYRSPPYVSWFLEINNKWIMRKVIITIIIIINIILTIRSSAFRLKGDAH